MKRHCSFGLLLLLAFSCTKEKSEIPDPSMAYADEAEKRPGGNATTQDESFNAFGHASEGLSASQNVDFVSGNSFFKLNWVAAPASTTSLDGVGPTFNAASCSGCHSKDGRGLAPEFKVGESGTGLLIRVGLANGEPHPVFGGQLQSHSLLGVATEPEVLVTYLNELVQYPDGSKVNMRKPRYSIGSSVYGPAGDLVFSPRLAPQIIGMGLLEAIPESEIVKNEDPNDANADGISGKANRVEDLRIKQKSLGRFGWKAGQPSVLQQTAAAFNGDMGIASNLFPNEDFTSIQKAMFPGLINGGSPEISDVLLNKVVLYSAVLSVPARPNATEKPMLDGKRLFVETGCAKCHIPKWTTGSSSILALSNQTIFPYSDLLLHDMGISLADNRPEADASGLEWRTPPLWGMAKIVTVNGKRFLMHDGRAKSIEEAILWHGGEAAGSISKFSNLPKTDRDKLVGFVESL